MTHKALQHFTQTEMNDRCCRQIVNSKQYLFVIFISRISFPLNLVMIHGPHLYFTETSAYFIWSLRTFYNRRNTLVHRTAETEKQLMHYIQRKRGKLQTHKFALLIPIHIYNVSLTSSQWCQLPEWVKVCYKNNLFNLAFLRMFEASPIAQLTV